MVEIWGALMGCAWIKGNRVDLIRKAVLYVHFMTAFYVVFCVGELLDTRIMRSLIMSPYLIACVRTFCKVDGVIVDQGKCIRDFSDRRMKVLGKIFDVIFFALHLSLVAFFLKRGGDSDSLGAVLQLLYMIALLAWVSQFCDIDQRNGWRTAVSQRISERMICCAKHRHEGSVGSTRPI